MTTVVTIASNSSQSQSGTKTIGPLTLTNSVEVGGTIDVLLASGANTITAPYGAIGAVIVPPTTNAVALTLKGVTGDTGIAVQPATPFLITFANPNSATNTFVITAASALASNIEVSFF